MKTTLKLLLTAAVAGALVGCASAGRNFDDSKVSQIHKGETTEAGLVALFGQPAQRGMDSDGHVSLSWNYVEAEVKGESFIPYAGALMGGTRSHNKTLSVALGPDGKVVNYTYSGGGTETSGMKQDVPNK